MKPKNERRRWPRETLSPPRVGVVHLASGQEQEPGEATVITEVHSISPGGALLTAGSKLSRGSRLCLHVFEQGAGQWQTFQAKVALSELATSGDRHLARVEFTQEETPPRQCLQHLQASSAPQPKDVEFLLGTPLFQAIPQRAVCPLLNQVVRRGLPAGQRLMTQGDPGDNFYIIQKGYCTISVERGGEEQVVNRLWEGDVVGEIAVLTGEPRSAHVDADSDLELWEITGAQFDAVAEEHPELRDFLTELVTQRLESRHTDPTRTVGKYLVRQKVGAGGWSIVYAGSHQLLDMPVAIKMMKHNLAMDEDFLENFRREARIIASLNHPNIVQVYDVEERFRTIFVIMEFLQGQSLEGILTDLGRLSHERAVHFLNQICQGLAYAHGQGIVHQDIKPANLFVKPDDHVKIVDFGLACPLGSEDLDLTGTLQYMAPEQLEGDPVDERTDLYCLGLTAYEMVCGQPPHPSGDLNQMVNLRLSQEIPDPAQLVPGMPDALAGFIRKACRRDPAQRYANAREALAELASLNQEDGGNGGPPAPAAKKITTLVMSYNDEQHLALNRLLDQFSSQLVELGVTVKAAEFEDM
jgi:eukaryotic-like serine/threonine-protein kinase